MLSPQQALKKYFRFDQFRDGQAEVIERVMAGQNTLLVMPTGSGKSLTYQLPAQLLPGLTLVISPLIALMQDQVSGLVEAGMSATFINSSLSGQEANYRMRAVLEGDVKLLYVAPERLRNRHFLQSLARLKISLLAIDEAHCISQWGHDFRPDYLQIGPTWQAMGKPPLLATTATATAKVRKDIINLLDLSDARTIVTGFNRPNLTFRVTHTPDTNSRFQALKTLLKQLNGGSAIIYAATRRNTEEAADFIRTALGVPAQAYHAGMDKDWRYQIQHDFMNDKLKIVVATNAFGMGIDKADVRQVIHYNMPATVEAYYQEAGRAGRDGLPAECVLLYSPDDQRLQEWMITSDTPGYDDLQQVYTLLHYAADDSQDNTVHLNRQELAQNSGLHPVKLRVTLSELELAGGLYHLGTQGGFDSWKILPLPDKALAERVEAIERRAVIRFNLLNEMLNYTHLTACRRAFLLSYFGDETPPKSPRCCDNHPTDSIADLPKAVTPQEWYPLVILETVRSLNRKAGRSLIAKILTGSSDKQIRQFGYERHKFYGKLERLSRKNVTKLIDELINARYLGLALVSGQVRKFSMVEITELGQEALNARAALPIKVDTLPDVNALPEKKVKRERSEFDTVEETYQQFMAGASPQEICAQRNLRPSTIYGHLAKLIEQQRLSLSEVVPPEIERDILRAVEEIGSAYRMSPIKAILPDDIEYGQIKCVISAHPELPREPLEEERVSNPQPPETRPTEKSIALTPKQANQKGASSVMVSTDSPDYIVMEAVAQLNGALGRTGLAGFLSGSRASWLEPFTKHTLYGRLKMFSKQATLDIIDALIADGLLKTTGGFRPKVILPEPYQTEESEPEILKEEKLALEMSGEPLIITAAQSPEAIILAVATDLEELITPSGLALLLSANAGDVVPFSDHELAFRLNDILTFEEIEELIERLLQNEQLWLNKNGRLVMSPVE